MKTRPSLSAYTPLSILDRVISGLELSPTQYEETETSYLSVGQVLLGKNSPVRTFAPDIFPQGSIRLGTTIRPIGSDHFDLDMVCLIGLSVTGLDPQRVYDLVWEALGTDGTYRNIREKKNRCIRLNYASSKKFHLDIIPAVPSTEHRSLYVPDREKKLWLPSHPVGYADSWFKPACSKRPNIPVVAIANESLQASAGTIEELPDQNAFEKTPLQRIVQLLKHHRDHSFQEDQRLRPSSILLTTVTTQSYLDAVEAPADNLMEFVRRVILALPNYIFFNDARSAQPYRVSNPVNATENFAENWSHEHYAKFKAWHQVLVRSMQQIHETSGRGLDVMLGRVSDAFGKEPVLAVVNSLGIQTNSSHLGGNLRVNSSNGRLGAVGTVIPVTKYYGK